MEYVFLKNAGRSISSNAWWNMIISHKYSFNSDGNDGNLWCTKQLLVVSFPLGLQQIQVAFQQRHEAPEKNLRPIQAHPGPTRKKKTVLRLPSLSCPERKTVQFWSKRKVNLEASEILMMLRMFKKNRFQNFARHSFSTSKTCHVELSMSWVKHPICFPILSCWVIFKIQEISKNHWKIPLVFQSTQEKPASCAAAAAWDKDSERWKPHRIIEKSMAFWVMKMRCLE